MSAAKKAANDAANAKPPQVDIAATDAQARAAALRNAQDSAALEKQFNPGAAELRSGSLDALLAALNSPRGVRDDLAARIAAQAGNPLSVPAAQQYDSALTRQAVEAASRDLSMGGQLPQDVRNLVAREAAARSGGVSGGLTLGRDISARDLGLTSLDLYQRRLQNAATLGAQEAGLAGGNAQLRAGADAAALQAQLYGRQNLFDSASFLEQIGSGDFQRALAAAQLGQNIAQPQSGLDPSAIANLAVGNMSAASGQQQQAMGLRAGIGNQQAAFGSQLVGTGLGLASQFYKPPATTPYAPYSAAGGYYSPPLGGNAASAAYVRST